ncbi:protein FAM200C-like [Palaemon carinicauda]|uniref:protein FAM200C-like n=1 Tax=Palaemon carinicauda TaxID=392227 RepID=UPI0035B5DA2A
MLIAKSKKSHNIGETLIKPSILCAAQLILGKDSANKLPQISLSNDTVQRRIHELSQDIKEQTLELVRASPVFAIQCDETTDIAQCAQFLMYARFVSGNNIKEEILFCCPMESLNLKLQGKNIHIISHHDTIRTFMAKLDLWKCRIQQGNAASFRNLDSGLAHGNLDPELKILIITHLSSLKAEFTKYFPDIDDMRESWKFIRNPFQCEFANVAEEIQEEFLELKFNSTAMDEFNDLDLETFWIKYHFVYPLISHQALRVLTMFGSTYLCETAFSTLTAIKTKYRNRLDVEDDLRCALSNIKPRIQDLLSKKQCQVSH